MATKYDVLAKLIERDAEVLGPDRSGKTEILVEVVRLISETHGSEDELADAIYEMLADVFAGGTVEQEPSGSPVPPLPASVPRSPEDGPNPLTVGF